MESQAKQKFILMSPRKIRRVINEVRGKKVLDAYNILRFMRYRAAGVVLKKLVDATNNAQVKYGLKPEELVISQIYADEGPAYRRFKPRAQGRVYKREKPTSHLTVCVAKKQEVK
ncbi:MAG: 50S ribosomal protein L22 [Vampirovibrio sp.]|nr:50S ribosomal protein L22 [Vampirovibrio sp.]